MTKQNRMNRLPILALLSLLTVLVLAGISMGADPTATFVSPTDGGGISGSSSDGANISVVVTTAEGVTNCSVTIASTITGDSTTLVLYNETTYTAGPLNNTFDSTLFQDGNDYVMSGTCYNDSESGLGGDIAVQITAATVYVDNSEPTASSILNFGTAMTNTTVLGGNNLELSFTARNATNNCSCYIDAPDTPEEYVPCTIASHSSNPTTGTCNGGSGGDGTMIYRIELNDYSNTTSYAYQFLFYGENGNGGGETIGGQQYFVIVRDFLHTKNGVIIVGFVMLALLLLVILLLVGSGKKRRRR